MLEQDLYPLLCKTLKEARLSAGLRQVDVAEKLGKPQSYVAKIENGERRIDLIETVTYCKSIGLDPRMLLDLVQKQ